MRLSSRRGVSQIRAPHAHSRRAGWKSTSRPERRAAGPTSIQPTCRVRLFPDRPTCLARLLTLISRSSRPGPAIRPGAARCSAPRIRKRNHHADQPPDHALHASNAAPTPLPARVARALGGDAGAEARRAEHRRGWASIASPRCPISMSVRTSDQLSEPPAPPSVTAESLPSRTAFVRHA